MKRSISFVFAVALVATTVSMVRADVKTEHKTSFQLGGTLGSIANRFAGDAAKDGIVSTMAIKGSRQMSTTPTTGRIVDLAEEKVYTLDIKKKEYRVMTFAELRQQWQDAQAKAQSDMKSGKGGEPPADPKQSGKQFEVSASVKETGQTRKIAGYDTHEVVITITFHEKGKKLEESGGLEMTNTMWLAPRVAALEEVAQFNAKYAKAVYGDLIMSADPAQMGMLMAQYPSFKELSEKMATEGKKLQGTPLLTTMVFEAVKDPSEAAAPAASQGGGGLMGRLASRIAQPKGGGDARSKVFTSTDEMISIATAVADADVAIPAGFKEKK